MGELFYLNFLSDGFGRVQIDEPIGYNALSFDFIQKADGFGRDITFNSGESQIEFVDRRNHYLDKLLFYNHHFGYESEVEIEVVFPDGTSIVHDIDFMKATTDDLQYFRCKMIQKNTLQIVKRREEVKVDLFSEKNVDGNAITPVTTKKILMQPKAIVQTSKWDQVEFTGVYMETKGVKSTKIFQGNPCQVIVQSDIDNTLTSLYASEEKKTPSDYFIIQAKNQISDLKVTISGITLSLFSGAANGGDGTVDFKLKVIYGKDEGSGVSQTFISALLDADKNQSYSYTQTKDFVINIPLLEATDKVWVYYEWIIKETSKVGAGNKVNCRTNISGMKITATATTISNFSVVQGVRLIDAMRQVVKSISGLPISAPMFDIGSQYYNTFLLSGNMLRGLLYKSQLSKAEQKIDLPFYLSLKDICDSIKECNADYEVNSTVFFGNERDFYTAQECGFFDNVQFHEFDKTFNERTAINQFIYKYQNYQARKENELPETADTVHGESILTLMNKNVENKKEINILWIRDSFLIEEARAKGLELTEKTSYQDDDKIFAIDTIIQTSNKQYKVTNELNHTYNPDTDRLVLKTVTINFVLMGIEINTLFVILPPHKNAGNYTVTSVTPNTVELMWNNNPPNSNNNGVAITSFKYTILASNVPLKNYTTEGFSNLANINQPGSYSNLRFSIMRNIQNYFQEYLATCNQYWQDLPLKNTWYKNNPLFTGTYQKVTLTEGMEYIPKTKILSPNLYDNVIFANVELNEFFTLQNNLRTLRGFVRCIDKNGNPIKLYPVKMNYQILSKELTITAEEKFVSELMTISTADPAMIIINDETSLRKIDWEIKDNKLYIYDDYRFLLYPGVFTDKVSINGTVPKSEEDLANQMKLLEDKYK